MSYRVTTVLLVMTLLGSPSDVRAQTPATTFAALQPRLRSGDVLTVTDIEGRTVKGELVELSAASLGLMVEGSRRDLPEDQVAIVRRRYQDSGTDGALIGAVVGALSLVVVGYAGDPEYMSDPEAGGVLRILGLGAGAGAGVGYLIDKAHEGQRTVYARPGRRPGSSTLSVLPVVGRHAKGFRVALRF